MKLNLKVLGQVVYSMEIQNGPIKLLMTRYKEVKHSEFETFVDKVLVPAAEHAQLEEGKHSVSQNIELSQITQLVRMADVIYQNGEQEAILEVQA